MTGEMLGGETAEPALELMLRAVGLFISAIWSVTWSAIWFC